MADTVQFTHKATRVETTVCVVIDGAEPLGRSTARFRPTAAAVRFEDGEFRVVQLSGPQVRRGVDCGDYRIRSFNARQRADMPGWCVRLVDAFTPLAKDPER